MLEPAHAPFGLSFNACSFVVFAALVVYYGNERSLLHKSSWERVFWFFIYAGLVFVFLLLPDSPLIRLKLLFGLIGGLDSLTLVVLAGYMGIRIHWKGLSLRLASPMQRIDLRGLAAAQAETVEARIATARIAEALKARHKIFGIFRSRRRERKIILETLEDCCDPGPENLLYLLNSPDIDVPQMLDVTARTPEVLKLLQRETHNMDVVTKARLIDAMQRQTDFLFVRDLQEHVVEILQKTGGKELSLLKSLLDEGGDYYNFHKLIFFDLAEDLRKVALAHVEEEGRKVRKGTKDGQGLLWKVLSDIDDTLFSSGGHFPAGCDRRYPKHQLYPGVLALFRELGRHTHKEETAEVLSRKTTAMKVDTPCRTLNKKKKQLSAALFENLMQSTQSGMTGRTADDDDDEELDGPEQKIWIRPRDSPDDEWRVVSVPYSETMGELRQRLEEATGAGSGALEEGLADISFIAPTRRAMSNLVFLSARPHAYKDYFENKTYQLFRQLRGRGMLHCMPTLLAGRIGSSLEAALRGAVLEFHSILRAAFPLLLLAVLVAHRNPLHPQAVLCLVLLCLYIYFSINTHKTHSRVTSVWQPVGEDKRRTFTEYRRIYRECDIVFLGDNGQGDLLCSEQLIEQAILDEDDDGLVFAFIHEVVPKEEQLSDLHGPEEVQKEDAKGAKHTWEDRGIFFHKTYIRAAINAYELELIQMEGLVRVARSAVEDMVRICASHSSATSKQRRKIKYEEIVAELNADVEAVNKMLRKGMPRIDKVPTSLHNQPEGTPKKRMTRSPSLKAFEFSTQPPPPADHH